MSSEKKPTDNADGLSADREIESIDDAAARLFTIQYPDRDFDSLATSTKLGWFRAAWDKRPAPAGQDLAAALMSAQSFIADGGHAENEPGSSVYRQASQALAALKDRA